MNKFIIKCNNDRDRQTNQLPTKYNIYRAKKAGVLWIRNEIINGMLEKIHRRGKFNKKIGIEYDGIDSNGD